MPLRAIIENKEVISTFLSKEEWISLRNYIKSNNVDVLISQTFKKGYLRTSKLGLQHFAHKKGEKPENWKPESQQHLLAKSEVLLGCKDAGWDAKSEFSENDWIADVIAIKGKIRVAFEIQWSRQSYEKTLERQNKFKNSNVRGCWFIKNPPKEICDWEKKIIAEKETPIFRIYETEKGEICIDLYGNKIPIRQFVKALLNHKIKYCTHLVSKENQNIEIIFSEIKCWKCKTNQHIYIIQDTLESKCGQQIELQDDDWSNNSFKHNPQIHNIVNNFLKTEKGKSIKIGEIKKRYSNTIKSSYISFGCIKCDSLFGDFYLPNAFAYKFEHKNYLSIFADIELPKIKEEHPHWCFSESKEFCE